MHCPWSARRAGAVSLLVLLATGCGDGPAALPPPPAPSPTPGSGAPPGKAPEIPAGHRRMLEALRVIRDRTADDNIFQGDVLVRKLGGDLKALPADAPVETRWRVLSQYADRMVYYGREREGLDRYREAYDMLHRLGDGVTGGERAAFLLRMAGAWLRFAETENCCAYHNAQSCILPLEGPSLHAKPEGSREAIRLLDEVLEWTPARDPVHLHAMWLRSMAAMTLGEYPDRVPEDRRVPPSFFAPDEPFPRMENVAGKVGLDYANLAGGAVADDFDNDGDMDLFIGNWDTAGQLRFFRNEGDGTFRDRTKEGGLEGLLGGLDMIQGDYDGDGWMDLFVPRGGWLADKGRHPDSLVRNNGDGTFTDRTWEAGLAGPDYPSATAVFLDYDNDGDLDLYVGNETTPEIAAPCQLFRNDGKGTFTEVAKAAGVTNDRFAKCVVAGDYDGDGFPDIYVSNLFDRNRLYRNRRDGTFEDVAPALGVTEPLKSFPAWMWDYDNDGVLDIMVYAFPVLPPQLTAAALGSPDPESLAVLYRGNGKGGFDRVPPEKVGIKPCSPMGNNFGDVDNDGFPDIYLGTGWPMARDIVPNVLYRNRRGEGFADVTLPSGTGNLQKGHGIAFADFDLDGDLDIFAQMGGAFISDQFHNALFENPGFGNRWLAVRLEGRASNRCAMGARIRADIVEDGKRRSVYRTVGSGGHFGANPLRQHLGLGRAARVEALEVSWPATGKTQVFRDLPADRLVEIVEGEGKPAIRELRPVHLGGGPR